jgi:hypothetical protein
MRHGFVSAGANYSDPANVDAINDVHQTIRTYFSKFLGNGSTNVKASSLTIVFFFFLVKHFVSFA